MKLKHLIGVTLAVAAMSLSAVVASAQTYYVDAKASPQKADGSEEHPFTKIQTAADIVNPGDTVLVLPGVYYESVTITRTGTKEKPIVFRAIENGENDTIVTIADKDIREGKTKWTLEDAENDIYSVPYERNVSNMMVNDVRMVGYNSLEELKLFESWKGSATQVASALDGPKHGYWWDEKNKKLYVHLSDDERYHTSNPNENVMKVGGPWYPNVTYNGFTDEGFRKNAIGKDSYCFGIWPEKDAYITISGFTTEVPGWTGVHIRANYVNIDNCWLRGALSGVMGAARTKQDATFQSNNISVTNCDWTIYPCWTDGMEGMVTNVERGLGKYFFWVVKAGVNVLHDAEAGAFVCYTGNDWTITHNKVWECEDGLSYAWTMGPMIPKMGGGTYWELHPQEGRIELAYNRFERCLDNAFELENHASNVDIHHNEFHDTFDSLSWQPLGLVPWPTNIRIHNNVWTASQYAVETYQNYTTMNYSWLKMGGGASSNFTGRYQSYMPEWPASDDKSTGKRPVWADDKGVWIYNNYVDYSGGFSEEIVGHLWGEEYEMDNINILNNIVIARAQNADQTVNGEGRRKFIMPGEIFDDRGLGHRIANNYCVASNSDDEDVTLVPESGYGKNFASTDELGITKTETAMEISDPNSILIGNGWQVEFTDEDTTTVGPLKYGETWNITYAPQLFGDVNRDKKVDLADVEMLNDRIGAVKGDDEYEIHFDLDYNDVIDENDLALIQAEYLRRNS